jgi:hypothetical protein
VPAARPLTFWLPLAAVLLRPVPLTLTEVALVLDQVIVEEPGAVALVGLALMVALTETGVLTVKVAV